ncbi:MAG: WD40 repeat domain-containing protein [Bacteroidota bacterium]
MSAIDVKKLAMFTGHRNSIFAMVHGREPSVFYSAGSDGMIVQWVMNEPDQGKLIARVPNTVYTLCYLQDSHQLVVGQNFDGIHFIDLHTNKEIASLQLTKSAIFDIKYDLGKLWVATGEGELIVIKHESLSIEKRIKISEKSLRKLALHPNGFEIAAGYSDHAIRIFSLLDHTLLKEITTAHTNSVFSLAYTPNGQYLLSGGRDAHLKIWETKNYTCFEDIVGHMYTINDITFMESGAYFATCSKDKSIKVWHGTAFKLLKVIDKARYAGHGTSVNKLIWLGTNNHLISASDDNTISIWDLQMNLVKINAILGK